MQLQKPKKSLAEAFPEIAAEWHPEKNGELLGAPSRNGL
jgi:hypothetical protein